MGGAVTNDRERSTPVGFLWRQRQTVRKCACASVAAGEAGPVGEPATVEIAAPLRSAFGMLRAAVAPAASSAAVGRARVSALVIVVVTLDALASAPALAGSRAATVAHLGDLMRDLRPGFGMAARQRSRADRSRKTCDRDHDRPKHANGHGVPPLQERSRLDADRDLLRGGCRDLLCRNRRQGRSGSRSVLSGTAPPKWRSL